MKILISLRKQRFHKPTYSVSIDGIEKYHVIVAGRITHFYQGRELQQSVEIVTKGWFKKGWKLEFGNGILGFIETINFVRGHYFGEIAGSQYEFYFHKGYKASVYSNNMQIAWWDKGDGPLFRADYYKIVSNNNTNVIALIIACLLIGDWTVDDATVSFGNLVAGLQDFDETWLPE